MSSHFLVVIPSDPKAALPETADAVRLALMDIAGSDEARVKDYGKLQFIDCGENFECASCPHCGADIALDIWQNWMDEAWHGADGFHLHSHTLPCCGASSDLNDLQYHEPQGFARWFVSARNPGRGPLTDAELSRLERLAGLKLTAIAQMY